jgi:hypothetical protein
MIFRFWNKNKKFIKNLNIIIIEIFKAKNLQKKFKKNICSVKNYYVERKKIGDFIKIKYILYFIFKK